MESRWRISLNEKNCGVLQQTLQNDATNASALRHKIWLRNLQT